MSSAHRPALLLLLALMLLFMLLSDEMFLPPDDEAQLRTLTLSPFGAWQTPGDWSQSEVTDENEDEVERKVAVLGRTWAKLVIRVGSSST